MGSPCTYDPTANVRILNSRFVHCSGYSGCDVTSYTTSRYLRMTSLSILPYKVPGSAAASGLHLPYGRMVLTASEMCHACSDTRRSRVRFSTRMTTILTYVSCGSPQPLQISRNHFLPRPSQIIIPGIWQAEPELQQRMEITTHQISFISDRGVHISNVVRVMCCPDWGTGQRQDSAFR